LRFAAFLSSNRIRIADSAACDSRLDTLRQLVRRSRREHHRRASSYAALAERRRNHASSRPMMKPEAYVPKTHRAYVKGRFGLIHYRELGQGDHAVLCLHQAPSSSLQYAWALPHLAMAGLRAIAIDYPGFGMSDPPLSAPSVGDYAEAALSVANALGLASFDAVGHHTGGMVAKELSLIAPSRVRKLVVHGAFPATAEELRGWRKYVQTVERTYDAKEDGSHLKEGWEQRGAYRMEGVDLNIFTQLVVERMLSPGPYWYGHNAAFEYDATAALKAIKHPTLLLSNAGDMAHEWALRAKALRPDLAWKELPGGDVDMISNEPERWAAAVVEFLKS
jgi:pimeloyl-ACP methyl ester carboxylesterase